MDFRICYDMITEILSRTSLKTLDTIRCTSKELEKLTYESYFLNLYNQRRSNNIVSGFLVQTLQKPCQFTNKFASSCESHSLDLAFLPHNAQILASSDQGIIVFQSPHKLFCKLVRYHVCKPATKEVLTLPNPKTKYLTKNVAIVVVDSKPLLHYKIIRLSEPNKPHKVDEQHTIYRYEVFDSKAWEWRVQDPVILPCSVFLSNQQPITTRGSIYMPLSNNHVLKIEAYSQDWTTFSLPIQTPLFDDTIRIQKLVKYKGKLGFICEAQSRLYLEIWVLRIDDLSWEKVDVLQTRDDTETSSLEAIYDSDTRVMTDLDTLLSYRLFTFRSDFEPAHF